MKQKKSEKDYIAYEGIQIEEKYRRQAEKLHRENPAVDAHLDLAGEVLIRMAARGKRYCETPLSG